MSQGPSSRGRPSSGSTRRPAWASTTCAPRIDELLATTPTSADRDRPRLWVDRSFAAKGSGTVVTGTLTGGVVAVDDEMIVTTAAKRGQATPVRVRGLQSHQRPQTRVGPGQRVAVNLTGVHHDDVGRGDALVRGGQWAPTTNLDASLKVLPSLDHDVSRRGAYLLYVGSGEYPAQVRVLGGATISPGEWGLVRCHLPVAVPLLPGDRFVLRESGRSETVGGGEILDVAPVLAASKARPSRSVERVIAERGWIDASLLERLTGERRPATVGVWVVSPDALAAAEESVVTAVAGAGTLGLDVATLGPRQRAVVAGLSDRVVIDAGRAWPAGRAAPAAAGQSLAEDPWLAALRASPWAPPPADGVDRVVVRELVRRGLVIERDGVHFSRRGGRRRGACRGPVAGRQPRRGHRGRRQNRSRRHPQARPSPAGPAGRHRGNPPSWRPANRRTAPSCPVTEEGEARNASSVPIFAGMGFLTRARAMAAAGTQRGAPRRSSPAGSDPRTDSLLRDRPGPVGRQRRIGPGPGVDRGVHGTAPRSGKKVERAARDRHDDPRPANRGSHGYALGAGLPDGSRAGHAGDGCGVHCFRLDGKTAAQPGGRRSRARLVARQWQRQVGPFVPGRLGRMGRRADRFVRDIDRDDRPDVGHHLRRRAPTSVMADLRGGDRRGGAVLLA